MDRQDHTTPESLATTDLSWALAFMLAVYIGLPVAGTLLLLYG